MPYFNLNNGDQRYGGRKLGNAQGKLPTIPCSQVQ